MTIVKINLRCITALLLSWMLVIPYVPVSAEEEELPDYYNRMTDADFFGEWDAEQEVWINEGAVNYSYSEDLALTEEYVKKGDYDGAKQALLYYYRNRSLVPEFGGGRLDTKKILLSSNDIMYFECNPIQFMGVARGAGWYSFDVTATSDAFLITSFENSGSVTGIYSRESEFSPYLVVEQSGIEKKLYPSKDTYLDCGNPEASFGYEDKMLVSDSGAGCTEETKQAYIRFDFNQTDRELPIDKATLYLYMETEAENHDLILFTSAEKNWPESACWNDVSYRVVSFRDIPGGYDWVRKNTSVGQYLDVNGRFLPMEPFISAYLYNQDDSYAEHGIRLALDFIKDNGGLYYDTNPSYRSAALEAGFRGGNALNSFFVFLNSPHMTADAACSMLKFFERESEGFAMEKFFDSYYNGGGYQTSSFTNLVTYFPEFRLNETWRELIPKRLDRLSNDLVRPDGTYLEATSGYADGVLGTFSTCIKLAKKAGMELSDEFMERYRNFSTYIMGISTPQGKEPVWGDGGAASVVNRIYGCGEILEDDEMLWFGSDGAEGVKPSYTSIYYPDGKLGVMRTGWETDDAYSFVIGRVGSSHSHTHTMHMEAHAYGRYLITDTGMTSYVDTHPHFIWQRTRAAAHNTVEINEISPQAPFNETGVGLSQSDMVINNTFDFFSGVTEGTEGYKHYRNIMFLKNRKMWLVSDYIHDMNNALPVNHYTQNWHMLSDAKPTVDTDSLAARSNYDSGANIQIVPVADENIAVCLKDGIAMQPGANARDTAEAEYVEISKDISGDGSFDTVLYPTANDYEYPTVSTERIPMPVSPEKASAYRIKTDDSSFSGTYFITNELVPMERIFGPYTAKVKNVYIETDSDLNESYICGTDVSYIEKTSETLLLASKTLDSVSASLSGGIAEIYTDAGFDPENDYIKVMAPDAEKIYLNGEEIPFGRQGEIAIIGRCDEETDSDEPEEDEEIVIPDKGNGSSIPSGGTSGGGGSSVILRPSQDPSGITNSDSEVGTEPIEKRNEILLFSDVQNHWAKEAIAEMLELGVVTGNGQGFFEPDIPVTRAQLAVMTAKLLKLPLKDYAGRFSDVAEGVWFAPYVEAMADAEIICGDGYRFRPNDLVTRQEAAKIMIGAYDYLKLTADDAADITFTDITLAEQWALPYILRSAQCGLINGFPDGSFRPEENMSRAQAAEILSRFQ